MMKSSQGATGQTGTAPSQSSSHNTRGGPTDYHNSGYRPSRGSHHDTVEGVSSHGQRSKSTSHHQHHAHHSNRDGGHSSSIGYPESSSGTNARNAQPRSHSHAKGTATRESHHQNNSGGGHGSAAHASSGNANAVGHYILGKALGEGTFGKVKLGTHVLTGEKVAVKVLEKSKIKDKKDVERISREIKILKQLHHPNVVQIYEIIETDKDLYLVMEFASGGELFELIVQHQKLKEKTASKHLQELLAGVHYIHQLGVCHRDLKPENLLLDFDGQLKIVDFGLSNMYEKNQTLKTACGSPCYAAPEMIAGNRYHGLKSDIWSCGVVLYAMLCGYLPFEDQKTSNLYKKIMNAEYSLPKFLSNDAKDILSKIFVTDPAKRIDIEGLKKHPWYRLYQPENQNYNFHSIPRTVNDKLVSKMEASLGFSNESVQRAVENNKHNHLSATYYLLLKKYACANYKSVQANRTSSIQARVDTRNPDYHSNQAAKRSSNKTNNNSDSKNRPGTSEHENQTSHGKVGSSSSSSGPSKYGKFRNNKEQDRLKAPVQDKLVLKNHRREQSANATAGRHNRNGDWGSLEDERRVGSTERPGATDEYEIVISKVNKTNEESKNREPKNSSGVNTTNMRAQFISPSPEIGPNGTRGRNSSLHAGKASTTSSNVVQKPMQASSKQSSTKAAEMVNIQNIKQQFNQVNRSSQQQPVVTRTTSLPKQGAPPPATFTHSTINSNQRSSEKQASKQSGKPSSSTADRHQKDNGPTGSSQHRKTKSTIPEMIQKQTSLQNPDRKSPLTQQTDSSQVDKAKFSQTQKIQNLSKSSGQQPRQQNISLTATQQLPSSSGHNKGTEQSHIQITPQQKTYFDHIAAKNNSASASMHGYIPSKQSSSEQTAGIEGNAVSDTVVNVNQGNGSDIFQSMTSVAQRPIIQDINSQNLLRRLESGNSENLLRQNFNNRQSQQTGKRKEDNNFTNDPRGSNSPLASANDGQNRRTLEVHDPRNANSRLSQISYGNGGSHYLNQPISKTPVTGYQTLDTMGDMSSHELKIPINPDTDRGVSKSIFYGTQRVANLNSEIQRYSNDQISRPAATKDFSKTQSVSGHGGNPTSKVNERSTKNVHQRPESSSRVSSTQPKTQHSTKHQRHATSISGPSKKEEALNSSTHNVNQRNGYSIPTQFAVASTHGYSTTAKSSTQKVSQGVKAVHLTHGGTQPQSSLEQTLSSKVQYNPQQTKAKSGGTHKTRSQSVSGAQKTANMYTPASHRKGNSSNQANSLLAGNNNQGASNTLTAHYRCSTASSTNKERRSSQPPQQSHHGNQQQQPSLFTNPPQQPQTTKQRSASSSNYQSAFLVKSLDGRSTMDGNVSSSQRTRQKSTRDSVNTSAIIHQGPNERAFQSITHSRDPNTSIIAQQLEETIMNQSFNTSGVGVNRYQASSQHHGSSHYNKRKQQVASISELLNVAETLKSTNYSVRPRQNSHVQSKENSSSDVRTKQNNYFSQSTKNASLQQQSQVQQQAAHHHRQNPSQSLVLSQSLNNSTNGGQGKHQPVVISDLGINFSSYQSQQQQPVTSQQSTIQQELKASLLLGQQQQQQLSHSGYKTGPSSTTQQQKHQSLSTTMKQITDGLMQRNSQVVQQQQHTSQHQPQPSQPQTQYQSYLSDLFAKQANQAQSSSVAKKQGSSQQPLHNSLFLNQPQQNQTQPINLKAALYSPTSNSTRQQQQPLSGHQKLLSTTHDDHHQAPSYSQKAAPFTKGQQVNQFEQGAPQSVLYSQQLQQLQAQQLHQHNLQQQPMYGYSGSNGGYNGASNIPPSSGKQAQYNSDMQQQPQPINLLQQHQQNIAQLSSAYNQHQPNNFMPPQQLVVNMQGQLSSHHQQQQKPPSVPAPSTAYQQMLQQQQNSHGVNFYPVQGGGHHQQQQHQHQQQYM